MKPMSTKTHAMHIAIGFVCDYLVRAENLKAPQHVIEDALAELLVRVGAEQALEIEHKRVCKDCPGDCS